MCGLLSSCVEVNPENTRVRTQPWSSSMGVSGSVWHLPQLSNVTQLSSWPLSLRGPRAALSPTQHQLVWDSGAPTAPYKVSAQAVLWPHSVLWDLGEPQGGSEGRR